MLKHLSELLVDLDTGPGVWGRVSSNRFSWIGVVDGPGEARRVARMICDAAADNRAGLAPRTGLAICPQDAVTPESARAAVREAMDAARDAGENLVAFDGGLMDGANPTGAPSASFRARRKRIAAIMDAPDALTPVYQPIVHMATLAVSGYEALTRVNAEPRLGPDQWITEAKRVGLGLEFEAECIRRALANRADLPAGAYLSVNSSPELVLSGRLDTLPPTGPLEWLMIEITEHEAVTDYGELGNRLDNLRGRGARVAVDDLGAGHSTLRHVMQMSPDFAKLDRSLVEGIDRDGAKQALVRSMVAFSNEVECSLVAEGVETPAEMQTLRGLGMDLGQGYLFQRPEPAIAPRLSEDRRRVIAAIRAA
ncbi:MAG: EAL domain-containing protein [Thermoleophilia bacterium]|nr:EAL domain-containing protein [Thermoleophilia bacterium]